MSNPYDPRPHPGRWAAVRSQVRRRWTLPFHFVEWLTRLTAYFLSHWSFLELLEYAGRFTVLVAVIVYFSEAPDRRKQKQYQAWQVINSAAGKSGNGGRLDALQELNEDGVSLAGIDVSMAFLQGLQLPKADLHFAVMRGCDLRSCNLDGASLWSADLGKSNFREGRLRNIRGSEVDLSDTDLTAADFSGADIEGADLRRAELQDLKWNQIANIRGANVYGVEDPPVGFLAWAMKNGAVAIETDDAWNAAKKNRVSTTKP